MNIQFAQFLVYLDLEFPIFVFHLSVKEMGGALLHCELDVRVVTVQVLN